MANIVDIEVVFDGSLTGLRGISDRGKSWISDNISAESWQMLGGSLWCDSRMAKDVIAGAVSEGLTVS